MQRSLAGLRLVAGVAACALVLTERSSHPATEWTIEVVSWAVYGVAGVLMSVQLRGSPTTANVGRVQQVAVVLDTLILLSQPVLHMYSGSEIGLSPVLVYPLLMSTRFAMRGAIVGTGVLGLALFGADRYSRVVNDYGLDPDSSIVICLLALAAGVVGGALMGAASEARALADAEARRARTAASRAERARSTMQAVHQVLSSGIAAGVHAACTNMAATIREVLDAEAVTIQLRADRDEAAPAIDITAGEPGPEPGRPIVAPVVSITGELLGQLQIHGAPPEHTDIEEVTLLADQVGLAAHAARILDEEAGLAGQYRDLDRLRTDFLALAAHELRTPTTAIHGALSTLLGRGDALPEDVSRKLLDTAGRQTGRLVKLADDLLTLGRSDAGDIPLRLETIDLLTLCSDVLDSASVPGEHVRLAPGQRCDVLVDVERARQIIANLVLNAENHGTPPIEVAWTVTDDLVEISVTDRGTIDEAERRRVFERFFVGDIDHHTRGSGLGLPISRDLAQAMGGELVLDESSPSTRFVLRLPVPPPRDPVAPQGDRASQT